MVMDFSLLFWLLREYLDNTDLASLALTCRQWNYIATPSLYHTVQFHNPGRIAANDLLQLKLEIFGDPRFTQIKHTKRVLITGSWYDSYHAIESNLGSESILSPAARMLNTIIASCVLRMPQLREFIWDLTVSTTQNLVTAVMLTPSLEILQLRMGTDNTPSPYFHPSLEFRPPINVRTLSLIEIDDESVLRSLGVALSNSTKLEELTIWADTESALCFSKIASNWDGQLLSELRSLDLRGFTDLGTPRCPLWGLISPVKLKSLTLHVGSTFDVADCTRFWENSVEAKLRPRQISTDLVADGLVEFIHSFSGLEALSIASPNNVLLPELPSLLVQSLRVQHSATLKVLSINPRGYIANYMDKNLLNEMATGFAEAEEFRFGIFQIDTVNNAIVTFQRYRFIC
ncbi:unnamed protein product [Penicillium pancosmium]